MLENILDKLYLFSQNGTIFLSIAGVFILFSFISFVLFLTKIAQLFKKAPPPPMEPVVEGDKDIAEVIKGGMILFNGNKYKYFLLNSSSTQPQKLPVGSKVKVLKKSKTEAYVKPME